MRPDQPDYRNALDQPYVRQRLGSHLRVNEETFGLVSEAFARYLGTPKFIVQMTVFIVAWLAWNVVAPETARFDPYTFTFLTLLLSLQASYAAPLILLAQGRQSDRDRVSLQNDRIRADRESEVSSYVTRELADLQMKIGVLMSDAARSRRARDDFDDEVREEFKTLALNIGTLTRMTSTSLHVRGVTANVDGSRDQNRRT